MADPVVPIATPVRGRWLAFPAGLVAGAPLALSAAAAWWAWGSPLHRRMRRQRRRRTTAGRSPPGSGPSGSRSRPGPRWRPPLRPRSPPGRRRGRTGRGRGPGRGRRGSRRHIATGGRRGRGPDPVGQVLTADARERRTRPVRRASPPSRPKPSGRPPSWAIADAQEPAASGPGPASGRRPATGCSFRGGFRPPRGRKSGPAGGGRGPGAPDRRPSGNSPNAIRLRGRPDPSRTHWTRRWRSERRNWSTGIGPWRRRRPSSPTWTGRSKRRSLKGRSPGLNREFVRDWLVIGPFADPDRKGHATAYPPEAEAVDQATEYKGIGSLLRWHPQSSPKDYIDLAGLFRIQTRPSAMRSAGSDRTGPGRPSSVRQQRRDQGVGERQAGRRPGRVAVGLARPGQGGVRIRRRLERNTGQGGQHGRAVGFYLRSGSRAVSGRSPGSISGPRPPTHAQEVIPSPAGDS